MNFQRKLKRVLDWSISDPKNLLITLGILLCVWIFGFVLLFGVPNWAIASSIEKTQQAINAAESVYINALARQKAECKWYTPSYCQGMDIMLEEAYSNLYKSKEIFARVETAWNPDGKVGIAQQARDEAGVSVEKIKTITDRLDSYQKLRQKARVTLGNIRTQSSITDGNISTANQRFGNEALRHLLKYTNPLHDSLKNADGKAGERDVFLALAEIMLPLDEDDNQKGDPIKSLEELDQAKMLIDEINSLMSWVSSTLDYLAEAEERSAPITLRARSDYVQAESHVTSAKTRTQYWLRTATSTIARADEKLKLAETTLTTLVPGEGKIDYPLAYEAAKESINLSRQGVREADEEIALAQSVQDGIANIIGQFSSVEILINNASSSVTTLSTYHSEYTWSDVGGNVNTARTRLQESRQHTAIAQDLSSLSKQEFSNAKVEIDQALEKLYTARNQAQVIIDKEQELERFRRDWPGSESSASSTIESERNWVNTYGSYSSSATSDFDEAVSLLGRARSAASSRDYQTAVTLANNAKNKADGTGSQAKRDYDDYQEEQERQRRAAEEAARRAAEEAVRQSQSYGSNSDYGGGSGYGGGSYDGGSSDYGGSSDFGGGGYDSDFGGGGSDSDW